MRFLSTQISVLTYTFYLKFFLLTLSKKETFVLYLASYVKDLKERESSRARKDSVKVLTCLHNAT